MRFSANISILFKEVPFLERFSRASSAGFRAVEFWWPTGVAAESIVTAARESGCQVVLFNLFNFGGIVVVSALGIATLVIISRRWDRPVRQTIRGTSG